jgi:GT2 family glycosyltransferase
MTTNSTILFPNYNNQHVLPLTFNYLRRNVDCSQVNLVMVDDGSEDDGLKVAKEEILKSGFAHAEVIELEHKGIVNALNVGLSAVKTEFVFRIDGDATVKTPGWLNRLRYFLEKYPEIGAIGGQVLFDDYRVHTLGRSVISEYGLHDIGTYIVEPVGRRTFDSKVARPKISFIESNPYEVDTIVGVCVGFRLSDALNVGRFDEIFSPVWIEDDDFGLSIRFTGKRIIVDPNVKVLHRVSLRGSRQPGKGKLEREKSLSPLLSARKQIAERVEKSNGLLEEEKITLHQESDPWRVSILKRHYQNWKEKWKFDIINPSLEDFYNLYWDTSLCWKLNPSFYAQAIKFQGKISTETVRI